MTVIGLRARSKVFDRIWLPELATRQVDAMQAGQPLVVRARVVRVMPVGLFRQETEPRGEVTLWAESHLGLS